MSTATSEAQHLISCFYAEINHHDFFFRKDFENLAVILIKLMEELEKTLSPDMQSKIYNTILSFNDFSKIGRDHEKYPAKFDSYDNNPDNQLIKNFFQKESEFLAKINAITAHMNILIEITNDSSLEIFDEYRDIKLPKDICKAKEFLDKNSELIKQFVFTLRYQPSIVNNFNSIKEHSKLKYIKEVVYFTHQFDRDLNTSTDLYNAYKECISSEIYTTIANRWYSRSKNVHDLKEDALLIGKILTEHST